MAILRKDKPKQSEYVELTFEKIVHETAGAYLLKFEESIWIPKSMIEDIDDTTVVLPQWLAEEKGLV